MIPREGAQPLFPSLPHLSSSSQFVLLPSSPPYPCFWLPARSFSRCPLLHRWDVGVARCARLPIPQSQESPGGAIAQGNALPCAGASPALPKGSAVSALGMELSLGSSWVRGCEECCFLSLVSFIDTKLFLVTSSASALFDSEVPRRLDCSAQFVATLLYSKAAPL